MQDLFNTQVALLSNVGLEHAIVMEKILDHHHLHSNKFFSKCVKHLSCQVGARKPTKLYYQSFLQQHPEFEGAAYLDDLQENLDMGKEFGFRPYFFSLEKEQRLTLAKLKDIESFILHTDRRNSRRH